MTTMVFWRNYYYVETRVGSEFFREEKLITGLGLTSCTISCLKQKPSVLVGWS